MRITLALGAPFALTAIAAFGVAGAPPAPVCGIATAIGGTFAPPGEYAGMGNAFGGDAATDSVAGSALLPVVV